MAEVEEVVSTVEQAKSLEAACALLRLDIPRRMRVALTLNDGWRASEPQQAQYYTGYLGMSIEMWNDKEDERSRITSPVITKVQSIGSAHRAHIFSSQRAMARAGRMWGAFMLDVSAFYKITPAMTTAMKPQTGEEATTQVSGINSGKVDTIAFQGM